MNRLPLLAYSALAVAALAFAAVPAWAQHGGGHGGGGHGGGGHGGGSHGGGSHGGGGGPSGGGAAHFSAPVHVSGGAAHVNGGTAHWSGGNARAFSSSPATRSWSGGTWNGTWNRGGHNNWGGYGYNGYNRGFYGGFSGFPWYWGWGGYPNYGLAGGYYNDSNYDSYPYYSDYGYNYAPDYSSGAPSNSSAPLGEVNTTTTAPAPQSAINDNAVLIGVRVPENAEVWIDGQKTSQTGSFREFTTAPLESGQKFIYDIKARWTENGKEVVRDRQLNFYAGDRLMVNMMVPAQQSPAQAPPAPRQAPPAPRQVPPPPTP